MSWRKTPKHSIIVCHPSRDSFTCTVANRYALAAQRVRHEVVLRDLYAIGFDPVLKDAERPSANGSVLADDVERELALLAGSDIFVLIYPIWFGLPPAMLKGYVDRVFGAGFSHRAVREQMMHPLMTGKALLSFTSSGSSRAWLEEQGAYESLRTVFDTYIRHAFSLASARHVHFPTIVENSKKSYIDECLFEVEEEAREAAAALLLPSLDRK